MTEQERPLLTRLADALAHYDISDADWERVREATELRDHHGGTIRVPVEVEWRNDEAYQRGYTEGRQQAVREQRVAFESRFDDQWPEWMDAAWDEAAAEVVAGLNASESPPTNAAHTHAQGWPNNCPTCRRADAEATDD